MKRVFIVASLAVVATLRASVTLTSLTGSPNVPGTATFAVNAAPLAGEYDWMFHFSTGGYGGSAGTILGVDLDGSRILTQPAPGIAQTWSATIPREMLKAGEHVFKFVNEGNAPTYISVDSIQLEPIAPPNGTILSVR